MEIRNLANTEFEKIIECLLLSFSDYFVEMPSNLQYWEKRFHAARVDYEYSFGVFENKELTAFIINGIDTDNNVLTAFNTGTGVIPSSRGNGLIDKMYNFAFPKLRSAGIEKCKLEVIQKNERAIKVYERIGFSKTRSLKCFKGVLKGNSAGVQIREISFQELSDDEKRGQHFYSWDHTDQAILKSGDLYKTFRVTHENKNFDPVGYFVIDPETGYLPQFSSHPSQIQNLFHGISQISKNIRINNVDESRMQLIQDLQQSELENTVDQFEMEMYIPKA